MTQIPNAGQVKQCPVYLRFYAQHNIPLNGQEWKRCLTERPLSC